MDTILYFRISMSIPKPKYCDQDWLEMKQMDSGRLCGQCKKSIVDFSNKKWSEIEEIQRANNNSVCGMYSDKQLKYWGQEVPLFTPNKKIISTAILIGLSTANLAGQTDSITIKRGEKIIIKGTVTGKSNNDALNTVPFASVRLKNTQCANKSDFSGHYEIDVTNFIDSIVEPILIFSSVGYDKLEYKIDEPIKNSTNYDVQLIRKDTNVTHFYITRPSRWKRFKRKIKRIFK